MTLFNIVSRQLKETNNIQLNKFDYDTIYVNKSINDYDLNKKTSEAIILNSSINLIFPQLMNIHNTKKYLMRVPIKFNKDNIEYMAENQLEIDFETPVMYSIERNENDELELGGKQHSDKKAAVINNFLHVNDLLIIMKLKNKIKYEIFIIKSSDKVDEFLRTSDNQQYEEIIESNITYFNTEKVVFSNKDNQTCNKTLFTEWFITTGKFKANEDTKKKYLSKLENFENDINEILPEGEIIDFWSNPKEFIIKYSKDDVLKIAVPLNNSSYTRKDRKGGTQLSASLTAYYSWADSLIEKQDDGFNALLEEKSRQIIYFGAPGTGKSYQLKLDSELFSSQNVERVTFHPNMSYGQFIGAFKPFPYRDSLSKESKVTYKFVPGVLMKLLLKALSSPNEAFLLIIEEINRANVSAVFGDFFQLLDRDLEKNSEYPITISEDILFFLEEEIYQNSNEYDIENIKNAIGNGLLLPNNFFIWSTMNSSDQGVLPMDTAFKRRWEQLYFGVNQAYVDNEEEFKSYCKINCGDEKVDWNSIRKFINDKLINENVPEDKLMGPYFISKNILTSTDEKLTNSFKNKVIMYLFEDAGKPCRKKLFNVVPEKMIYSEVLSLFEKIGLEVFIGSEEIMPNSNLETKENQ